MPVVSLRDVILAFLKSNGDQLREHELLPVVIRCLSLGTLLFITTPNLSDSQHIYILSDGRVIWEGVSNTSFLPPATQ